MNLESLERVPWTKKSVAQQCQRCSETIGVDESCYIEVQGEEQPVMIGNDARLYCDECVEEMRNED